MVLAYTYVVLPQNSLQPDIVLSPSNRVILADSPQHETRTRSRSQKSQIGVLLNDDGIMSWVAALVLFT